MRLFRVLFILFNIYLIGSASDRTEVASENSAREESDKLGGVLYEEYDYDDGKRENFIVSGEPTGNTTGSVDSGESFPNEVFLSLRNITADAATAFRSFTHRNDVADLQASASDNLNVTTNSSSADAESAGINLRALRDAGHPPVIIEDTLGAVHLPYKHAKIDTADLSDCALQGEWKPMGVAHSHLQVGGGGDHSQQVEILQSVGSYAVPNKVIPLWGQNQVASEQIVQDGGHRKPFGGGHAYASGYGSGGFGGGSSGGSGYSSGYSGSGFGGSSHGSAGGSFGGASAHSHSGGGGGYGGGGHGYAHSGGGFGGNGGAGHSYGLGSGSGGGGHSYGLGSGSGGHSYTYSGLGSGGVYSGSGGGGGGGHAYASQFGNHIGVGSQSVGFSTGQKVKHSMFSPPPVPPIIFGKKPGYWKVPKTRHKYTYSKNKRPGGSYGFSNYANHAPTYGGTLSQGGSGYRGSSGGSGHVSVGQGSSGHIKYGYEGISGGLNHGGGGGGGGSGLYGETSVQSLGHGGVGGGGGGSGGSGLYGETSVQSFGHGGVSVSNGLAHSGISLSGDQGGAVTSQGVLDGATVGHLIAEDNSGVKTLSSGGGSLESLGYTQGGDDHVIAAASLGGAGDDLSSHVSQSGGGSNIVTIGHGGSIHSEAYVSNPTGASVLDSTFSSSQISSGGGGSQFPGVKYLPSQDFTVHGQGVPDGGLSSSSSSSTFTCGTNHDHNTNYHTATFQVADHDHPSSVDVLQYGGDAAVLIQSGDASFHDQLLPERKHYKTATHLSDTEASGSDNTNDLTSQAALTGQPAEPSPVGSEPELTTDDDDDGGEPERHSYYHEITKVTKIPITSVGSIQKYYSQYETKPQVFTTETEPSREEEPEQPQIIRELEHLSNKFQLDVENPQKLFEDPPNEELTYHYPFQEEQNGGKGEGVKEGEQGGVTEFPYKFYQSINQQPVSHHHKRPPIKYIPRPGKVTYEKPINYIHPKPVLVVRKHKPKQFLKKQNYEVMEHGGERHRPIGEIFPPQKFPKQFHNPKPNFAVERPKKGWRPEYQEYKYDYSQGKKIRKYKTKAKLVAPIIIRRPVSPAPVLRVVEVSG